MHLRLKISGVQLRYLRSQLRDLGYIDAEKLSPSFKRGPYKFLSAKVDQIIHDRANDPAVKLAAKFLDSADAYYGKEMARFRDHLVQNLVDNIKSGLPPNPQVIARIEAYLKTARSEPRPHNVGIMDFVK